MATYIQDIEVTHACGCTITHTINGKLEATVERKRAEIAANPCYKCQRKAKEQEELEFANTLSLPALEGTEKQLKWAVKIRAHFAANVRSLIDENRQGAAFKVLRGITNARDYINNRDMGVRDFLNTMQTAIKRRERNLARYGTETVWKRVAINVQNIACSGDKAARINFPHSSDLDGFSVWFPISCIRDGSHDYEKIISIPEGRVYKAQKYGRGQWNRFEVIDTRDASVNEIAEAFGGFYEPAPKVFEPNPYEDEWDEAPEAALIIED